jgi:hypothetical protein
MKNKVTLSVDAGPLKLSGLLARSERAGYSPLIRAQGDMNCVTPI